MFDISRQSVLDLVKRRRENGRPVSWGREDPDNPVASVLVLASFVLDYAASLRGIRSAEDPLVARLPVIPNQAVFEFGPASAGPGEASSELVKRLDELNRLLESSRAEASEERMARLEAATAAAEARAAEEHSLRIKAEAAIRALMNVFQ